MPQPVRGNTYIDTSQHHPSGSHMHAHYAGDPSLDYQSHFTPQAFSDATLAHGGYHYQVQQQMHPYPQGDAPFHDQSNSGPPPPPMFGAYGPSGPQEGHTHLQDQSSIPTQPSFAASPHEHSPSKVKSLTCYFWAEKGRCKWTDEECLYAHYHTGKLSNPPVQVEPGCPYVAGRNASNPQPVYENWRRHNQSTNEPAFASSPRFPGAYPESPATFQAGPHPYYSPYQQSGAPTYDDPFSAPGVYTENSALYMTDVQAQETAMPYTYPEQFAPVPADVDVAKRYHLASYHYPGALHGGLHQYLCARSHEHLDPPSSLNEEMLHQLVIKNGVIADLSSALDAAIRSLEGRLPHNIAAETSVDLAKRLDGIATNDRFEIKYVGPARLETPDYREIITDVAAVLRENGGRMGWEGKGLREVRGRVGREMEAIGAGLQLPPGWVEYPKRQG